MKTHKINSSEVYPDNREFNEKNVIIDFKCQPKLKLQLTLEANNLGMTLSELIQYRIMNLEESRMLYEHKIFDLRDRLSFYENKKLLFLFNQYESKEINFVNSDGIQEYIKIRDPKDVYTIVINSFKISYSSDYYE